MARNEQLIRQHKLLQLLERSRFGRTLGELRDDLVEELGLSSLHTRSVRRDLEALQAAGFDISAEDHQRGRIWRLGRSHRGMHKITATATELTALSMGRDLLLPLAGTPFWQGIESFWHKVREALPDSVWKHYQKYRQVLYVLGTPAKSYEKQQGILKTINRAILEHRVVEIEYQSMAAAQPRKRLIHPYAVALYQSSLYIIAEACDATSADDALRHLKLDRFRRATALDEWFQPRKDLNMADYLGESIGIFARGKTQNFRIRISPLAARWVEEDPWHPNQTVQRRGDGSVVLSVRAAHELEIIPRVLALGAEAELLAPAACRRQLAAVVEKMHERYSATAS